MARRKLKQTKAARAARARDRARKRGSGRAAFGLKGKSKKGRGVPKGVHAEVRKKLSERYKKKGGFLGTLLAIAAPILADVIGNALSKK